MHKKRLSIAMSVLFLSAALILTGCGEKKRKQHSRSKQNHS